LERVVPSSTAKNGARDEIFDLMGYALPPGTVVSTQAWSMHRDSTVFPSPETFLPERWLEGSQAELANMNQHMMPFGTGSRVCGGQNLAQVMLRVAIAAIVKNFTIAAPAETNERSMEIKDSFVSAYRSTLWRIALDSRTRTGYFPCGDGVQAHLPAPSMKYAPPFISFSIYRFRFSGPWISDIMIL
jgi:hypothetical protein